MLIRAHHLRLPQGFNARAGFCLSKSKLWAESQGIDWRGFVRDGIDSETLLATGDPMAIACVKAAEDAEAANGR